MGYCKQNRLLQDINRKKQDKELHLRQAKESKICAIMAGTGAGIATIAAAIDFAEKDVNSGYNLILFAILSATLCHFAHTAQQKHTNLAEKSYKQMCKAQRAYHKDQKKR